MKRLPIALLLTAVFALAEPAAPRRLNHYILLLQDPPLVQQVPSRKELRTKAAASAGAKIESAQAAVKRDLAGRKLHVLGSVQTLLNAVFVAAPEESAGELAGLPGVRQVLPSTRLKLHMNRAVDLVNAPQAWAALGGQGSAGAGVKIGIVDTGIDQNHPAFRDENTGLQAPPSYPPQDVTHAIPHPNSPAFTNGKVIVARSYVEDLTAGSPTSYDARFSLPDDYSPRDHVGHGTAVAMIAAGAQHQGPGGVTLSGVAPKAWLGSYKVYGAPGVNETTFDWVIVMALEDAYKDGMDVVVLAQGSLAVYGPKDKGLNICSDTATVECDVRAMGVERAVTNANGMTVVTSAGNDGDIGRGDRGPTLNTIHTPGTAPSGITVGATTNVHNFFSTVSLTGPDAPANLTSIPATMGDGPRPASPLTAPLRDVAALDGNGLACGTLGSAVSSAIALIQRGGQCGFETKALNAQKAGAVGVIFYQSSDRDYVIEPFGQVGVGIPAVMVNYTNGKALKDFIAGNFGRQITIDPRLREITDQSDTVAFFSSRGPSIQDTSILGAEAIKPELVAPGVGLFAATQSYDPNSDLYSSTGYTSVQGTSFSAAFVAGAAALVKAAGRQRNVDLHPGHIKSALVHTANATVLDGGSRARVTAVGAGKLNALAAVQANVAVEPATISFGALKAADLGPSQGPKRTLTIWNTGTAPVHLTLDVAQRDPDGLAQVSLTKSVLDLAAGAADTVQVQLTGSLPAAGAYEGVINVQGGAVPLRVPYLYMTGDNVPYNIYPLLGFDFMALPGERVPGGFVAFRLLDRYGVPVWGAPNNEILPGYRVAFGPTLGGGRTDLTQQDQNTDRYGIASSSAFLGPNLGEQEFTATIQGFPDYKMTFGGIATSLPAITTNGVVNAASFDASNGLAPGSYISIFGNNLSTTLRIVGTQYLPLSLAGSSVSFDVEGSNPGYPGHIHFVSPTQINVQIPWELQGKASANMKVTSNRNHIDLLQGDLYPLPLAAAAPGMFEIPDPTGGTVAAALDTAYGVITSNNPAQRGQFVQIYANGLGPVTNQPPSGEPTQASPFSTTTLPVQVSMCGKPGAAPYFSGLAPGYVGLYQINVQVPQDCGTGMQGVVITVNGVASKSVRMPIR